MFGLIFGLIPFILLGVGIYLVRHGGSQRFKLAGGIVLIVLGILGIIPISLPYGLVAFNAARCGHMPVIGSDFAASYTYSLPSDSDYRAHISIFDTKFFCSEGDAQAKGYHH